MSFSLNEIIIELFLYKLFFYVLIDIVLYYLQKMLRNI